MLARIDVRGISGDLRADLARPDPGGDDIAGVVAGIVADVRARGDVALRELTARFDGAELSDLRVDRSDRIGALASTPPALRAALELARDQILAWHEAQREKEARHERLGVEVHERVVPVDRAGCYVPGGRARYPSSVLMTAVPARVAGVPEVVLCVPPNSDGTVSPVVLVAAELAGVDEVYRIGGAQAIAALAYGTESIRPVDVVVGPGNAYVAEAKRQVVGVVGIDGLAGPSEVAIVADDTVDPAWVAADLLAQAEHGPGGAVTLIVWDEAVAERVDLALETLLLTTTRRDDAESTLAEGGRTVLVEDAARAVDASNAIAPEHLELMCADAALLVPLVRNAGAVFVGPYAPAVLGDYAAGTNHVLPTGGTARFSSALRVADFQKHIHVVHADRRALERLSAATRILAEEEGLTAHADAVRLRERGAGVMFRRPEPRDDLKSLEGYHSPQVEIEVRLNTNESPYPPPAEFVDRWLSALRDVGWHRYPDRAATELRSALGVFLGQSPMRLLCGNGSNEVLQTLLLTYGGPGRRALMFEPTYALHAQIARGTGTEVVAGERRGDYTIDIDDAVATIERTRPSVVFICSPNNPTGTVEPRATIEAMSSAAASVGAVLVVDEAYGEFAPWSAIELVDDERALVVCRTYSKVWSLAAVRLGFAVAPAWMIGELEKVLLPYNLSVSTQVAGTIALEFRAEMEQRVASLVEERGRLFAALAATEGIDVCPSGANFLLMRIDGDAHDVWKRLLARGVLVRDFSSWPRVEGCLRVTVGTPAENDAFLAALAAVLPEVLT